MALDLLDFLDPPDVLSFADVLPDVDLLVLGIEDAGDRLSECDRCGSGAEVGVRGGQRRGTGSGTGLNSLHERAGCVGVPGAATHWLCALGAGARAAAGTGGGTEARRVLGGGYGGPGSSRGA